MDMSTHQPQQLSSFQKALQQIDMARLEYQVTSHASEALQHAQALEPNSGDHGLPGLIKQIDAVMPLTSYGSVNGSPNVNDKQKDYQVVIGREYSRVVYVKIIKTHGYGHLDDGYWQQLRTQLELIGHRFSADENWLEEEDNMTLIWRYWWD